MSHAEPLVSIVVPVRGDSTPLSALLAQLPSRPDVQIIISSMGPTDSTHDTIREGRTDVTWVDGLPGRGVQLNAGAELATGRWLWFVHADSQLPATWFATFEGLDSRDDVVGGCPRRARSGTYSTP